MVETIKKVSIIGIGNLGKQIAKWAAFYGYNVTIFDIKKEGLRDFVDNTIFEYNETWWLFTSNTNSDVLYLYYSSKPPWLMHSTHNSLLSSSKCAQWTSLPYRHILQ